MEKIENTLEQIDDRSAGRFRNLQDGVFTDPHQRQVRPSQDTPTRFGGAEAIPRQQEIVSFRGAPSSRATPRKFNLPFKFDDTDVRDGLSFSVIEFEGKIELSRRGAT